jgi:hypothetical protein
MILREEALETGPEPATGFLASPYVFENRENPIHFRERSQVID